MHLLGSLFGDTAHISWAQECARAVVVLAFGLVAVRAAGRRIFARWAAPDIVVAIVIGSNLSRALTGNAPFWGTLAATGLLIALHWLVVQGAARSPRVSRLVEGCAITLGANGRVRATDLLRHSLSEADLAEALRQAGVESLDQTRLLVLEPSGKVSILKASPRPFSPPDMHA